MPMPLPPDIVSYMRTDPNSPKAAKKKLRDVAFGARSKSVINSYKVLDEVSHFGPGPAMPDVNIFLKEKLKNRQGNFCFGPGNNMITTDDLQAVTQTINEKHQDSFMMTMPVLGNPL